MNYDKHFEVKQIRKIDFLKSVSRKKVELEIKGCVQQICSLILESKYELVLYVFHLEGNRCFLEIFLQNK